MFKKTDTSEENVAKQSIRKMDKVVTGLLLSSIVASIYGVKKLHDKRKLESEHQASHTVDIHEEPHHENSEKKPSLWSRILFGNK